MFASWPLRAERRSQDLLLDRVIAADHLVHALRRDDRDIIGADQLGQATVVVGVRLGEEHGEQRLAQCCHAPAQHPAVGDRQQAVDRDHARRGLDEVCVHQRSGRGGRDAVDQRWFRHRRSLLSLSLR
jgi:hypothetical protein